jgi:phosphatidate phosphatase
MCCWRKKKNITGEPDTESATSSDSSICERVIQIFTDWFIIGGLAATYACIYVFVDPKVIFFTCNDSNEINYPFKTDTVPFWAVCVYGVVGPTLFILLVEFKNAKFITFRQNSTEYLTRFKNFLVYVYQAFSLFALGVAITLVLTEIGKRWVGRLRPHFLSVCMPNMSLINCEIQGSNGFIYSPIYTGDSLCTGNASDIQQARLSWPSGHSSFAWYDFNTGKKRKSKNKKVANLARFICFVFGFTTYRPF